MWRFIAISINIFLNILDEIPLTRTNDKSRPWRLILWKRFCRVYYPETHWMEESSEQEHTFQNPNQHLYEEEMQMQHQEEEEERYLCLLRANCEEEQRRAAIDRWLKDHPEDPWGDGREFPWADEWREARINNKSGRRSRIAKLTTNNRTIHQALNSQRVKQMVCFRCKAAGHSNYKGHICFF